MAPPRVKPKHGLGASGSSARSQAAAAAAAAANGGSGSGGSGRRQQQKQQPDSKRRGGTSGAALPSMSSGLDASTRCAFVQRLMAAGLLKRAACIHFLEHITGEAADEPLLDALIGEQNSAMVDLGFRLRSVRCPVDKQHYVGFVNTLADGPAKLGSRYSIAQRHFFQRALEAIALDPDIDDAGVGQVSSVELLNLDLSSPADPDAADGAAAQAAATAAKKLSKTDKQATLHQLARDGWLAHSTSASGWFCIGPRAFLELPGLLLGLDLPQSTRHAWEEFL